MSKRGRLKRKLKTLLSRLIFITIIVAILFIALQKDIKIKIESQPNLNFNMTIEEHKDTLQYNASDLNNSTENMMLPPTVHYNIQNLGETKTFCNLKVLFWNPGDIYLARAGFPEFNFEIGPGAEENISFQLESMDANRYNFQVAPNCSTTT